MGFVLGAFGFERQNPPEGKNIITTTRSHSNRAVTEAVESCQPSEVVRVGGAGHKVCGHTIHDAGSHYFMVQGHTISWCRVMVILFHNTGSQLQYLMVYSHGHTISYHMVQGDTVSWCRVTVTLFHNTGSQSHISLFHNAGLWSHYFIVQGHGDTIS